MASNGSSSSNQPISTMQPNNLPTWDAKSLLNPKAAPSPSASASQPSSRPRAAVNGTQALGQPVFQFSNPDDDFSQPSTGSEGDAQSQTNGNGMGAMIQRINNVEDRSHAPNPKRRKIDGGQLAEEDVKHVAAANGRSSGMLAGYINEKQHQETNGTKPSASSTPNTTVDLTDSNESDVHVVSDPKMLEVCYGMINVAHVNCHKVPWPRPGSVNIGGPTSWPTLKVVMKRKVGDATSTVMFYDHTREVFGKLDSKTSSGLVPLLDSAALQLRTECRIPARKREADEAPGQPTSRAYKVEIVLHGLLRYVKQVGKLLRDRGLQLQTPPLVARGTTVVNPHANDAMITGAPAYRAPSGMASNGYNAPPTARTVEEVRSEVLNLFDSIKSEELPEMDPDPLILTELLPHQKQGLYFMSARENPDENDSIQRKHIGRLWQRKVLHGGQVVFQNVLTGQNEPRQPPDTLGGILADMMGLGKTLSILSLIVGSQGKAMEWANMNPRQPVGHQQGRRNNSNKFNAAAPEPLGLTKLARNAKTTLLVCPLSTVTNWEEQIKAHIAPNGLTYHIYHGQNRIKDPEQLAQFDLVITTYGSVSSELTARSKRKAQSFPLEEIGWFRIVLDEAHMIREQSTLQFKAICRLQAGRRWAVTGTPVQNRLDDLAALLAFIRLKPFDDRNKFNQFIVAPFKLADPDIIPKLRALVDTITLRRLKDKIHLPPRSDQVVKLDFSPEERKLYELFERNAKDRVQVLTGNNQRIVGGKTYIHILQSILRLRLICAHGRELLSDEDLKTVQGMSQESAIDLDSDEEADSNKPALADDHAYRMFELMKETNSDKCFGCQRKLGSNDGSNDGSDFDGESEGSEDVLGYMTPSCFHVSCPKCVRQSRNEQRGGANNSGQFGDCPTCKSHIPFSCVELRRTRADVEHESAGGRGSSKSSSLRASGSKNLANYGGPHTKTRALIEDLLQTKAESQLTPDEPPFKSVVFSGWTSHLDLIQLALDQNGIKATRLDGSMTRMARTHAMDLFREDPTIEVILVSIMAGGLGLNLTAGNRVYVMEPLYNPAAEAQAVDRVHRLGQKRAVRTVRYIMKDSFEEQMVALQEKKIKLASLSMDRGDKALDKGEAARQRLKDLQTLFK